MARGSGADFEEIFKREIEPHIAGDKRGSSRMRMRVRIRQRGKPYYMKNSLEKAKSITVFGGSEAVDCTGFEEGRVDWLGTESEAAGKAIPQGAGTTIDTNGSLGDESPGEGPEPLPRVNLSAACPLRHGFGTSPKIKVDNCHRYDSL